MMPEEERALLARKGEGASLKHTVGRGTIAKLLKRNGIEPA
jgi:hypothetical protein